MSNSENETIIIYEPEISYSSYLLLYGKQNFQKQKIFILKQDHVIQLKNYQI